MRHRRPTRTAADDVRGRPAGLAGLAAILACIGCEASLFSREPYPATEVIADVVFDWTTHRREAPGSDNWPVTWGTDDQQYTSWGDGGGFGGTNEIGRVSLGFARVDGDAASYRGSNTFGGIDGTQARFGGKSYGIVDLPAGLYSWVSPGSDETNYESASLLRSRDGGRSWDSTSVRLDRERHGVILPVILNFGRGYSDARDEYVYHYVTHLVDASALAIQRPGRIYLLRSPLLEIENQASYQWFAGLDEGGQPRWTAEVDARSPVFQDDRGVGWNLSVSYNRGLGQYFLITEHDETGRSNIGMFVAPEPWGPWQVVHYESAWGRGEIEPTAFYWNFSNKWLSDDGLDFVLVFSGYGENDSWNTLRGRFVLGPLPAGPPSR